MSSSWFSSAAPKVLFESNIWEWGQSDKPPPQLVKEPLLNVLGFFIHLKYSGNSGRKRWFKGLPGIRVFLCLKVSGSSTSGTETLKLCHQLLLVHVLSRSAVKYVPC